VITKRFVVIGQVQGVGFRHFTRGLAERYGIKGYVKNLYDGSVEALAQGEEAILIEFEKGLRQGPRWSYIEEIKEEILGNERVYEGFRISF
jgi:acylphosphatase